MTIILTLHRKLHGSKVALHAEAKVEQYARTETFTSPLVAGIDNDNHTQVAAEEWKSIRDILEQINRWAPGLGLKESDLVSVAQVRVHS